jgi:tetratricopeptide (TPR) repeat protein
MNRFLSTLTLGIFLTLSGQSAWADQKDPRLSALFDELKNAKSAAIANTFEDKIWQIWLEHSDKRTQEVTLIGISFMNSGQFDLAELAFTEAIDKNPDFAEAWNKRATLRYLVGDLEGSVADCANVLNLEPRHYGAMAGLGMISAARSNWKRAIEWYQRALTIHPNFTGAKIGLEQSIANLNAERI